ncbi:MAG: hypothetical protein ACYDBB_21800 [Armatimonadota bacterium]
MSRDFVTAVISRAVHEEIFRQLLQNDAEAAADAMEMEYTPDDLRELQALQNFISGLDSDKSREYLQGIAHQPQDVFGSPQRPEG